MKPVYLIKYEHNPPHEYETRTYYYEIPFEDDFPVDKLKELLENDWNLKDLKLSYGSRGYYGFEYNLKTKDFFIKDEVDRTETISVETSVALKIGERYYECKELDVFVEN